MRFFKVVRRFFGIGKTDAMSESITITRYALDGTKLTHEFDGTCPRCNTACHAAQVILRAALGLCCTVKCVSVPDYNTGATK